MLHDLHLQHSITDVAYQRIDYVCCRIVSIKHVEGVVQYVLDWLVIVRGGVKLGVVVSAGEGEATYDVQISGHVNLYEPRRGWDPMFIGDGEWDKVLPDVVDESLGQLNRHCCASVSQGGRWPY